MGQLRGLIGKLEALREELVTPKVFYAAHREDWHALAVQTVRDVLVNLRPATVTAEAWERQIEAASEAVSTELLTGEEAGLVIRLSRETTAPDIVERAGFTIEEIQRWVAEGRDNRAMYDQLGMSPGDYPLLPGEEDVGKRLDERDANKSDLQIAWNIIYALNLNRNREGLSRALNKFLGTEAGVNAASMDSEIRKAWVEIFSVRAQADFQTWVRARVKQV